MPQADAVTNADVDKESQGRSEEEQQQQQQQQQQQRQVQETEQQLQLQQLKQGSPEKGSGQQLRRQSGQQQQQQQFDEGEQQEQEVFDIEEAQRFNLQIGLDSQEQMHGGRQEEEEGQQQLGGQGEEEEKQDEEGHGDGFRGLSSFGGVDTHTGELLFEGGRHHGLDGFTTRTHGLLVQLRTSLLTECARGNLDVLGSPTKRRRVQQQKRQHEGKAATQVSCVDCITMYMMSHYC